MQTIILHGWEHNANLWKNMAVKIGRNVMSIDLPGFGSSPLIKDDWGIPQYAEWVEKKIKNDKGVVLIGHSFGGRIVAEIASKQPKWLKGIILSGAPCLYRPTLSTKVKIRVAKIAKKLLPNSIRTLFYTQDLKAASKKSLEKIFRKAVNYDQTAQLKKIDIPALLIWGENDDQVPVKIAHEMKKLIPNSNLKIIENAGHNVYLEKPDLFACYVKNHIKDLPNT